MEFYVRSFKHYVNICEIATIYRIYLLNFIYGGIHAFACIIESWQLDDSTDELWIFQLVLRLSLNT